LSTVPIGGKLFYTVAGTLNIDVIYFSAVSIFPADNYFSIPVFYRNGWKCILSKNISGNSQTKKERGENEFMHKWRRGFEYNLVGAKIRTMLNQSVNQTALLQGIITL
jgi:hypothetical protein